MNSKEIDWPLIHKLTENAAWYAPAWPPNFGGKGSCSHVSEENYFGLAKLYHKSTIVIEQAWDLVHSHAKQANEDRLREMLFFALSAGKLHQEVVKALGGEPNPWTLCYVSDHGNGPQLHVTGLRWRWSNYDNGFVPADAVQKFVDGGPLVDLKNALKKTEDIRCAYDSMVG